jgi:hypothetical protein
MTSKQVRGRGRSCIPCVIYWWSRPLLQRRPWALSGLCVVPMPLYRWNFSMYTL